jgi:hypothetical protein
MHHRRRRVHDPRRLLQRDRRLRARPRSPAVRCSRAVSDVEGYRAVSRDGGCGRSSLRDGASAGVRIAILLEFTEVQSSFKLPRVSPEFGFQLQYAKLMASRERYAASARTGRTGSLWVRGRTVTEPRTRNERTERSEAIGGDCSNFSARSASLRAFAVEFVFSRQYSGTLLFGVPRADQRWIPRASRRPRSSVENARAPAALRCAVS